MTYSLICGIANLLAHEVVHPLGGLVVAVFGVDAGYHERHFDYFGSRSCDF